MKKIFFAAGITIIGLSAAFAQEVKQTATPQKSTSATGLTRVRDNRNASPETAAQRRTDRLDKELSLTDDQKKKVYDVFLQQSKENQGRPVQSEAIDNQLKGILNAEQNQKYEAMKAERKQMMQQR